jgi:hypothetical protein
VLVPDPEDGQQATAREVVDGRALAGQHEWVTQAHHDGVHAELETPARAGEGRHRAHGLELRLGARQAIGLPDGVDLAPLAQIHPAEEGAGALERVGGDAEPDANLHEAGPAAFSISRT